MIDAILTNTMLPAISRELLNRMVVSQPVQRIAVTVTDGNFGYNFD